MLHIAIIYYNRNSCDCIKGHSKNLRNPQAVKCLRMLSCCLTTSRRCSQSHSLQWTNIVLSCHNMITCIHTKTLGQPSSSIKNIKKLKIANTLLLASSVRLSPIQVRIYYLHKFELMFSCLRNSCTNFTLTSAHTCQPI
jgi:hypothetical protein